MIARLTVALIAAALAGCAVTIDPATGRPVWSPDPASVEAITRAVTDRVISEIHPAK